MLTLPAAWCFANACVNLIYFKIKIPDLTLYQRSFSLHSCSEKSDSVEKTHLSDRVTTNHPTCWQWESNRGWIGDVRTLTTETARESPVFWYGIECKNSIGVKTQQKNSYLVANCICVTSGNNSGAGWRWHWWIHIAEYISGSREQWWIPTACSMLWQAEIQHFCVTQSWNLNI